MKAIIVTLILFLLNFVYSTTKTDTFPAFRLALTKSHLLTEAKLMIEKLLANFTSEAQEPMISEKKLATLTFNIASRNIKSTSNLLLNGVGEMANGTFKVSFYETFTLIFNFDYVITVGNAHIDSGAATIVLAAEPFNLIQDYSCLEPTKVMTIDFTVKSIKVNSGIFSESVGGALSTQFMGKMVDRIKKRFEDYLKAFPVMEDFETFTTTLKSKKNATLIRSRLSSFEEDPESNQFVRLLNANVTVDNTEVDSEQVCVYDRQLDPTKSELCFCKHLFPRIIAYDTFYEEVDLDTWGLKGKGSELYEIVPNLIHLVSADTEFLVRTNLIHPEVDTKDMDKILLFKRYAFVDKRSATSHPGAPQPLFDMVVKFELKLKGVYDEVNKVLNIVQEDVQIEEIKPSEDISFSSRIILGQYIKIEMENMKNQKIIPEGIKIPFNSSITHSSEYNNGFCVQA